MSSDQPLRQESLYAQSYLFGNITAPTEATSSTTLLDSSSHPAIAVVAFGRKEGVVSSASPAVCPDEIKTEEEGEEEKEARKEQPSSRRTKTRACEDDDKTTTAAMRRNKQTKNKPRDVYSPTDLHLLQRHHHNGTPRVCPRAKVKNGDAVFQDFPAFTCDWCAVSMCLECYNVYLRTFRPNAEAEERAAAAAAKLAAASALSTNDHSAISCPNVLGFTIDKRDFSASSSRFNKAGESRGRRAAAAKHTTAKDSEREGRPPLTQEELVAMEATSAVAIAISLGDKDKKSTSTNSRRQSTAGSSPSSPADASSPSGSTGIPTITPFSLEKGEKVPGGCLLKCHGCNKGALTFESVPLIPWTCAGPYAGQRITLTADGRGVKKIALRNAFDPVAVQKYHANKDYRVQRAKSSHMIYADVIEGCRLPAAPAHQDGSTEEEGFYVGYGASREGVRIVATTKNTSRHQIYGAADEGDRLVGEQKLAPPPKQSVLPPHITRGAVCVEGGIFEFRVTNYGPRQPCVWCVVSSSKSNEDRAVGGPGGRFAAQTIVPIQRWYAPPTLPGVEDSVFSMAVPKGLWHSEYRAAMADQQQNNRRKLKKIEKAILRDAKREMRLRKRALGKGKGEGSSHIQHHMRRGEEEEEGKGEGKGGVGRSGYLSTYSSATSTSSSEESSSEDDGDYQEEEERFLAALSGTKRVHQIALYREAELYRVDIGPSGAPILKINEATVSLPRTASAVISRREVVTATAAAFASAFEEGTPSLTTSPSPSHGAARGSVCDLTVDSDNALLDSANLMGGTRSDNADIEIIEDGTTATAEEDHAAATAGGIRGRRANNNRSSLSDRIKASVDHQRWQLSLVAFSLRQMAGLGGGLGIGTFGARIGRIDNPNTFHQHQSAFTAPPQGPLAVVTILHEALPFLEKLRVFRLKSNKKQQQQHARKKAIIVSKCEESPGSVSRALISAMLSSNSSPSAPSPVADAAFSSSSQPLGTVSPRSARNPIHAPPSKSKEKGKITRLAVSSSGAQEKQQGKEGVVHVALHEVSYRVSKTKIPLGDSPDIATAVDNLLAMNNVAICGIGSKIDFLRAISLSAELGHKPLHELFCFASPPQYQHNQGFVFEVIARRQQFLHLVATSFSGQRTFLMGAGFGREHDVRGSADQKISPSTEAWEIANAIVDGHVESSVGGCGSDVVSHLNNRESARHKRERRKRNAMVAFIAEAAQRAADTVAATGAAAALAAIPPFSPVRMSGNHQLNMAQLLRMVREEILMIDALETQKAKLRGDTLLAMSYAAEAALSEWVDQQTEKLVVNSQRKEEVEAAGGKGREGGALRQQPRELDETATAGSLLPRFKTRVVEVDRQTEEGGEEGRAKKKGLKTLKDLTVDDQTREERKRRKAVSTRRKAIRKSLESVSITRQRGGSLVCPFLGAAPSSRAEEPRRPSHLSRSPYEFPSRRRAHNHYHHGQEKVATSEMRRSALHQYSEAKDREEENTKQSANAMNESDNDDDNDNDNGHMMLLAMGAANGDGSPLFPANPNRATEQFVCPAKATAVKGAENEGEDFSGDGDGEVFAEGAAAAGIAFNQRPIKEGLSTPRKLNSLKRGGTSSSSSSSRLPNSDANTKNRQMMDMMVCLSPSAPSRSTATLTANHAAGAMAAAVTASPAPRLPGGVVLSYSCPNTPHNASESVVSAAPAVGTKITVSATTNATTLLLHDGEREHSGRAVGMRTTAGAAAARLNFDDEDDHRDSKEVRERFGATLHTISNSVSDGADKRGVVVVGINEGETLIRGVAERAINHTHTNKEEVAKIRKTTKGKEGCTSNDDDNARGEGEADCILGINSSLASPMSSSPSSVLRLLSIPCTVPTVPFFGPLSPNLDGLVDVHGYPAGGGGGGAGPQSFNGGGVNEIFGGDDSWDNVCGGNDALFVVRSSSEQAARTVQRNTFAAKVDTSLLFNFFSCAHDNETLLLRSSEAVQEEEMRGGRGSGGVRRGFFGEKSAGGYSAGGTNDPLFLTGVYDVTMPQWSLRFEDESGGGINFSSSSLSRAGARSTLTLPKRSTALTSPAAFGPAASAAGTTSRAAEETEEEEEEEEEEKGILWNGGAAMALLRRKVVDPFSVASICCGVVGMGGLHCRGDSQHARIPSRCRSDRKTKPSEAPPHCAGNKELKARTPHFTAATSSSCTDPTSQFSTFRATGHILVLHSIDSLNAENIKTIADMLGEFKGRLQLLCSFDDPTWLSSQQSAMAGGGAGSWSGGGGAGTASTATETSSPGGQNSPRTPQNSGEAARGTNANNNKDKSPLSPLSFERERRDGGGGNSPIRGGRGAVVESSSGGGGGPPHGRQALAAAAALATQHKFVVIPAHSKAYAFMPFIQETCHVSDAALLLEGGTASLHADGGGGRRGAGGGGGSIMAADLSSLSVSELIGAEERRRPGIISSSTGPSSSAAASHPLANTALADTIRRVLLSLPQSFSDILRHILNLQKEKVENSAAASGGKRQGRRRGNAGVDSGLLDDGDDDDTAEENAGSKSASVALSSKASVKQHAIPIHTIAPYVERAAGILLTSHRLDAVLREMTSNRMAAYDGSTHSVFIPHYLLILTLLGEIEEQRNRK